MSKVRVRLNYHTFCEVEFETDKTNKEDIIAEAYAMSDIDMREECEAQLMKHLQSERYEDVTYV